MKNTPRWHKTAEEGIPKKDGDYLVHHKASGTLRVAFFTLGANSTTTPQNCCYDYWYDFPVIPEEVKTRVMEDDRVKWDKQKL